MTNMASNSSIEWTSATWNPVTGCTRASDGCDNCYAVTLTKRLAAMGQVKYQGLVNHKKRHFNGKIKVHRELLDEPLRWRKPRTVFVNSMSDLFHEKVDDEIILEVFDVMRRAKQHSFQILTKRAERLEMIDKLVDWPDNVWMGVSVENESTLWRTDHLKRTGAKIRFLSLEPLLGPLHNLRLTKIHWVIVGGESGPKARPMHKSWVMEIRDKCRKQKVPFFFKQWGGKNKKEAGRVLNGRTWDEMPKVRSSQLNMI